MLCICLAGAVRHRTIDRFLVSPAERRRVRRAIDQDSLSKLFSVQPEAFLATQTISADYSADDGSGDDL